MKMELREAVVTNQSHQEPFEGKKPMVQQAPGQEKGIAESPEAGPRAVYSHLHAWDASICYRP